MKLKKNNMYFPAEMLELVFGFGFSWCITTGRLVNKEWKQIIDKLIHNIFIKCIEYKRNYSFNCELPIYNMNITKNLCFQVLLFNLIIKIGNEITIQKNSHKKIFTIKQCSIVHSYVFSACSSYGLNEQVYKQLKSLFDYSLLQCINEGVVNMQCIKQYRRFYRIIFGYIRNYNQLNLIKDVNILIDESFPDKLQ